jgi:hypothetical protein
MFGKRHAQPHQQPQQAEDERAVALAERPVVAPGGAHGHAQHARHLGDDGEARHQRHEPRRRAGQEREGQVERRVGGHVGELVQVGAQLRGLPELAREHAVDGVEGHAHEEPRGQQQEERGLAAHAEERAQADRDRACEERDLVGAHARFVEAPRQRPQHRLEPRLKAVDGHRSPPRDAAQG